MRSSTPRPKSAGAKPSALRRALVVTVVGSSAVVLAVACDTGRPTAAAKEPRVENLQTASQSTANLSEGRTVLGREAAAAKFSDEANAGLQAQQGRGQALAATATAPAAAPTPATQISAVAQPSSSMIIRTGYAGIEVDSLEAAIARVRALAARVGGFVANTAVQGGKDQLRTASLEVKVPSDRFDEALTGLAPIGKVESVNVSAQDVGEEYVDIAARVENAHRLEERLINLLANRTGKLQDVLTVERELARIREEIERYEGRMRYLRTRASISTLTIAVHERAPIIVPVAGDGPIVEAFREAWRNFVGFVATGIASLGVLVPLGALLFVGWLGVRRFIPLRPASQTPPAAGAVSGD